MPNFGVWLYGTQFRPMPYPTDELFITTYLTTLSSLFDETAPQGDNDNTAEYPDYLQAIRDASARITAYKKTLFEPYKAAITLDAKGEHIAESGRLLLLAHPVLSVESVTLGNGVTPASSAYTLIPKSNTPHVNIYLNSSTENMWTDFTSDYRQVITINATWGFHPNLAKAWVDATTINDAGGISDSDTEITFADASGLFAGMLLRIESEYVRLLSSTGDVGTVERGVNGTTAAAHADGVTVDRWSVWDVVEKACRRWAAYLVAKRGALEKARYDSFGNEVEFPPDMPGDVQGALDSFYVYHTWGR